MTITAVIRPQWFAVHQINPDGAIESGQKHKALRTQDGSWTQLAIDEYHAAERANLARRTGHVTGPGHVTQPG
jgi:hypothetical protein